MVNLRSFLRRLQTLWRSRQLHQEIAEEMRFHIDQVWLTPEVGRPALTRKGVCSPR